MSSIERRPPVTNGTPRVFQGKHQPSKESFFKDRMIAELSKKHEEANLNKDSSSTKTAKNVHVKIIEEKVHKETSSTQSSTKKDVKVSLKLLPSIVKKATDVFMTHVMRKTPPSQDSAVDEQTPLITTPTIRGEKPLKPLERFVARAVLDRALTESEVKEKLNTKEIQQTFNEVGQKVENDKPPHISHKEFIKCFGKPKDALEHLQIRKLVNDYNKGKISFEEFVIKGNDLASGSSLSSASKALAGMDKIVTDPTFTDFVDQLKPANRITNLMIATSIISDLSFSNLSVKFAANKFAKMGIKDAMAREGQPIGHITNIGFPGHLVAMEVRKSGENFEVNISNFGFGSQDKHDENSVKQFRIPSTPEGQKQLQKFITNMYVLKYDLSRSRSDEVQLRTYHDNLKMLDPVIDLSTTLRQGQNTGSCTVKNPLELVLFALQREGKIDQANLLQSAVFERAKASLTDREDPFGLGAIPPDDIQPLRKSDIPNFSIVTEDGKTLKHYINVNREELCKRVPIYENYDQSHMLDLIQSDSQPKEVGKIGFLSYVRT